MKTIRLFAGLVVGVLALTATAVAAGVAKERVEISAPIFPRVPVLYAQEGTSFPTTLAGEQQLVKDASLTFESLLSLCQPKYPGIKIPAAGAPPLTTQELSSNFELVAECSYEQYTAKPYWIPRLVADVDLCGQELGAGWGLLTEDDLAHLDAADFQYLADTLQGLPGQSFGGFYFSLKVYLRATDGSLKQGDLRPGAATRISALGADCGSLTCSTVDGSSTLHLEGGTVVRCIRRTPFLVP